LVPVIDLSRRGARFADAFGEVARRIAAGGAYLLGDELVSFEAELAGASGAGHAAGVASGAAALQLALTAAGVRPGDDVLIPAFTAVPTASAVIAAGARPVVVDVDPDTACVTPDAIATARTERTTAVVVVHLYGYVATLPDTDLIVIEDAAQAIGSLTGPRRSSAIAYSFYPTKNLGGIGDGGAVVTDDTGLVERVRRLRAHGMTQQYVHEWVSQNFRLSELEAAWLRLGLPELAGDVVARREIAARYRAASPGLRWQSTRPDHSYHLCVFRSAERDATRATLAEAGVGTAVHYPLALTQQPAYAESFAASPCPRAEAWAAECISVPCFPEMTSDEIDHVAGALAALPNVSPGVAGLAEPDLAAPGRAATR
jgi:dTDP-4-amino-4,6-dideoxygalactose transaminase